MIEFLHTDITVRTVRSSGWPVDETGATETSLIEIILREHKVDCLIEHPLLVYHTRVYWNLLEITLVLVLGDLLANYSRIRTCK